MNYNIIAVPHFRKEIKKLSKKYPSIKSDFAKLIGSHSENPKQESPLGNKCYKVRMAISSKAKGKSGGSRIITYVQVTKSTVYLLTIYDKSDKEKISDKELYELLSYTPE